MITSFRGRYRFLSNFYPAPVRGFPTVEHAYQAAKCADMEEAFFFRDPNMTPGQAKRLGARVKLWDQWNDKTKLAVMNGLLREKFKYQGEKRLDLALLATGDQELIEGNTWGDRFWGQCPVGSGENHLGKILMKVRNELKETK